VSVIGDNHKIGSGELLTQVAKQNSEVSKTSEFLNGRMCGQRGPIGRTTKRQDHQCLVKLRTELVAMTVPLWSRASTFQ
jgi:hypothetical protein